jgi:hypothetical protein
MGNVCLLREFVVAVIGVDFDASVVLRMAFVTMTH